MIPPLPPDIDPDINHSSCPDNSALGSVMDLLVPVRGLLPDEDVVSTPPIYIYIYIYITMQASDTPHPCKSVVE